MKKASKPTSKKPAAKKPAAKKSPTKPKRKAETHSQLSLVVTRLELVADKLAQAAERLSQAPLPPLPVEVPHPHTDEHSDDVEVPTREE
jgi:hypothetical protein